MMGKMCHQYTEEDKDIIRRDYKQDEASTYAIAGKLGVSYHAVKWQAKRMGLCKRILQPNRKWDSPEDDLLKELIGLYSTRTVAEMLGRSVNAVVIRLSRLGISPRTSRDGWYTRKDVCYILGIDHRKAQYYIDRGMLRATRHNGHKKNHNGAVWHIGKVSLKHFIQSYPEEFNGRNVDLVQIFDILGVLRPIRYGIIGEKDKTDV